MEYKEVLDYIENSVWRGSRLGLGRITELLCLMGNPQKKLKYVHVAGTNGKGSTSSMIASVLQAAGYHTGLYISPFIHRFNERMQVDGCPVSDEELAELFTDIQPLAESMDDRPTEFEWITALAFSWFARNHCDIVVLEVGLGGEYDATNVIDTPEVAVITALGMDHMKELGDTIEDITKAKAGIIKQAGSNAESPAEVVYYGQDSRALAVIERRVCSLGCRLTLPDYDKLIIGERDMSGQTFSYGRYKNLRIGLLGTYQPYNAALAIETIEALRRKGWKINDEAVRNGLCLARHDGRFEKISDNPVILVDGAHNPQGIRATARSLYDYFPDQEITILIGVLADKDVSGMLEELTMSGLTFRCFVTVTPPNSRAMDAVSLAGLLQDITDCPVIAASSIYEGCRLSLNETSADGVICALGSLYMADEVMRGFEQCHCTN